MKNCGKIGAIVQARMGSERLPGKSLMTIGDKPLLVHIIENLKSSKYLSRIVLATTERKEDKVLMELAEKLEVSRFAGSEKDVLARFNDAAVKFELNVVVRICGDNILTDINGMERTVAQYLQKKPDLAINGGKDGYPLGTGVEVFPTKLLQNLNKTVNSLIEREHVTLHIYNKRKKYHILALKAPVDYGHLNLRLTIDTPEDLLLMRLLYEKLNEGGKDFKLPFIAEYIRNHPEIKKINSHIKQRRF